MNVRIGGAGLLALLSLTAAAADEIPLEVYGKLPTISSMALSPGGSRVAYRRTTDESDVLLVQDLGDGSLLGGADVSETNPRRIIFADEDHVILFASEAARVFGYRNPYSFSGSLVLDVKSGEVWQLLVRSREIQARQSGLGRIIGHSRDREYLYMPAFLGGDGGRAPRYGVLKVELDSNRDRIIERGTIHTVDWLVDDAGNALVEAEMHDLDNVYRIYASGGDERELLYEAQRAVPVELVGLTPDLHALVLPVADDAGFVTYETMDLESGEREQFFGREDASVERPLVGLDRLVHGVEYTGFLPSYGFIDKELERRVASLQEKFGDTGAYLESWTPGFEDLLFELSGGWTSGMYVLVSRDSPTPRLIARKRPDLPDGAVVPTRMFEYAARDGLRIPALLTAKPEVLESGGASLIVLPHGGPESYDRFRFDWLVQYFANRGHAVLQPQFRGSRGFGVALQRAGHGEWGRKMSTDLDDGVQELIDDGVVDPERICMVGISYGGYAALAAGAFSPVEYRCLVSVNGVSDLTAMLRAESDAYGSNHWVVDYWEKQFGSASAEREALEAISPAENADAFRAPVLLLHGKDDTTVPPEQSRRMERALEHANKQVELVRLDGEDHYLSKSKTRLAALRTIAKFVDRHL